MISHPLGRSTFGNPANTGNLMPFEEALTFTPLLVLRQALCLGYTNKQLWLVLEMCKKSTQSLPKGYQFRFYKVRLMSILPSLLRLLVRQAHKAWRNTNSDLKIDRGVYTERSECAVNNQIIKLSNKLIPDATHRQPVSLIVDAPARIGIVVEQVAVPGVCWLALRRTPPGTFVANIVECHAAAEAAWQAC